MTKQGFVEAVAARAGLSRRDAALAVDAIIEVITEALEAGDSVSFTGFGRFTCRDRAARMGTNPRTGERIHIQSTRTPLFVASRVLKDAVVAVGLPDLCGPLTTQLEDRHGPIERSDRDELEWFEPPPPPREMKRAKPPMAPPPEPPEPNGGGRGVAKNGGGDSEPAPASGGGGDPELVAANGGRAGAGGSDAPRDPPREAYGLLRAPETVAVESEFALTIGLSAKQEPGVAGGALVRPPSSVGPYTVTIEVDTEGFLLREGELWRNDLDVTYEQPYPSLDLHLQAAKQDADTRDTKIQATFSVEGQTIGLAVRYIAVVRELAAAPEAPPAASGVTMSIPSAETAPDLTIQITQWGGESGGRLHFSVKTPHPIPIPKVEESDIGSEPEEFARKLIKQMTVRDGRPGLYALLLGRGKKIARQIPKPIRDTVHAVAEHVAPRQLTCLLLSEEPYVPWELAVLDPPLDPGEPPFLATQVILGRWVLTEEPPPEATPRSNVPVEAMAVVCGEYGKVPGWKRLQEAEEEAGDLRDTYAAASVDAETSTVLKCLQGDPEADILHFAVHGQYDPAGTQDGLALVDGQMLDPDQVGAYKLSRRPFVFLNACQVGSGSKVLGDYAGMAASFLSVDAAAVIAPLWSVNDKIARAIACSFYEKTLRDGRPPAEVLMEERRAIGAPGATSGTHLAYQFFGHPLMRLAPAAGFLAGGGEGGGGD
jgi:nucleoid DNA-binding protein